MSSKIIPIDPGKLTSEGRILGAAAYRDSPNVWDRIAAFERLFPIYGQRFADVGGGTGSYSAHLIDRCSGDLVLLDYQAEHVAEARGVLADWGAKAICIQGSAEATGLESESFDCVFMVEMLDHVNDVPACLREANRILKRGGRLYIAVPNRFFPMETHPVRFGRGYRHPIFAPFLPWLPRLHRRMATASVFTVHGLRRMCHGAGFESFRATHVMPPLQRFPSLRPLSKMLEKTPLRLFGIAICSVAVKS